jgi:predicted nucleotidyltransferase
MVAAIINDNRDTIVALCRKHRVRALWVFGSATTDAWDPATSDVDFLVDLGDYDNGVADRFLNLADDLEVLVGRSIDIITVRGLAKKPRMEERINAHRVELYDAERDRSAA